MLKNVKWVSLGIAVIYIVGGVLLFMYPTEMTLMFSPIMGGGLIAVGLLNIIIYFTLDKQESFFRNDFAEGLIRILIGILIIMNKNMFNDLITPLLCLAIAVSTSLKLQDGIDARRLGVPNFWMYFSFALISLIPIALALLHVIQEEQTFFKAAGIALVYCGLSDLILGIFLSTKIHKYVKDLENPKPEEPAAEPEPAPEIPVPEAKPEDVSSPVVPEEVHAAEPEPLSVPELDQMMEEAPEPEDVIKKAEDFKD